MKKKLLSLLLAIAVMIKLNNFNKIYCLQQLYKNKIFFRKNFKNTLKTTLTIIKLF